MALDSSTRSQPPLQVQFIIVKINNEKHRKSRELLPSLLLARLHHKISFFISFIALYCVTTAEWNCIIKIKPEKYLFNLPASKILCFTECCRECQNCHALISSSGLFSSRNISMMTLCEWKQEERRKLNENEISFRKFHNIVSCKTSSHHQLPNCAGDFSDVIMSNVITSRRARLVETWRRALMTQFGEIHDFQFLSLSLDLVQTLSGAREEEKWEIESSVECV